MLRKSGSLGPSVHRPFSGDAYDPKHSLSPFSFASLPSRLRIFARTMSPDGAAVPPLVSILIHGVGVSMGVLAVVWVYGFQGGAGWFVDDMNLLFNVSAGRDSEHRVWICR